MSRKNLSKDPYWKMMYYFFSLPSKEIGLNGLSKQLGMSKTTTKSNVESLIKEGFLKKKVYGNSWIIYCDKGHIYNSMYKIPYNLSLVLQTYHDSLREYIINQIGNFQSVCLFGSYCKGDDNEESDIDIAVEVLDDDKKSKIKERKIKSLGYRTDVPVNFHVFTRKDIDKNLFANIANGIVIEGFLEV